MTNQMKMILLMENIKKYSEGIMKIYQIGKSIIVEDAKSVKNITELRPSITSSLELIKVAINNDLSVSEYLTKIMSCLLYTSDAADE